MKFIKWMPGTQVFVLIIAVAISLVLALNQRAQLADRNQTRVTAPTAVLEAISPLPVTEAVSSAPEIPALAPFINYRVMRGDTLTKIARESCNPIDEIAAENHISDPNIIREFSTLVLKRVQQCSPVVAKSKTSPGNSLAVRRGASREKSFSSTAPRQAQVVVRDDNCDTLGARIKGDVIRILFRAKCIEEKYGKFIRAGILETGQRVSLAEVIAIMLVESKGNPLAVSTAKVPCLGLMQLQPPTASDYGVVHIFDPRENIIGGIRVYADYARQFGGSKVLAVVAYNIGPNGLRKKLARFPLFDPATHKYYLAVERVRVILEEHLGSSS